MIDTIKITIKGCARCGETHEIEFSPFAENAIECSGEILTHWGMCPNLNEPILLRIQERDEARAGEGQPSKALGEMGEYED